LIFVTILVGRGSRTKLPDFSKLTKLREGEDFDRRNMKADEGRHGTFNGITELGGGKEDF
jgi:hypothetical protein